MGTIRMKPLRAARPRRRWALRGCLVVSAVTLTACGSGFFGGDDADEASDDVAEPSITEPVEEPEQSAEPEPEPEAKSVVEVPSESQEPTGEVSGQVDDVPAQIPEDPVAAEALEPAEVTPAVVDEADIVEQECWWETEQGADVFGNYLMANVVCTIPADDSAGSDVTAGGLDPLSALDGLGAVDPTGITDPADAIGLTGALDPEMLDSSDFLDLLGDLTPEPALLQARFGWRCSVGVEYAAVESMNTGSDVEGAEGAEGVGDAGAGAEGAEGAEGVEGAGAEDAGADVEGAEGVGDAGADVEGAEGVGDAGADVEGVEGSDAEGTDAGSSAEGADVEGAATGSSVEGADAGSSAEDAGDVDAGSGVDGAAESGEDGGGSENELEVFVSNGGPPRTLQFASAADDEAAGLEQAAGLGSLAESGTGTPTAQSAPTGREAAVLVRFGSDLHPLVPEFRVVVAGRDLDPDIEESVENQRITYEGLWRNSAGRSPRDRAGVLSVLEDRNYGGRYDEDEWELEKERSRHDEHLLYAPEDWVTGITNGLMGDTSGTLYTAVAGVYIDFDISGWQEHVGPVLEACGFDPHSVEASESQ